MEQAAQRAAAEIFGESFGAVESYVGILATDGVTRGLIGPRETERLWSRHILNSVACENLIPQGVSVLDVGSGAGLPGIPLALVRPDLDVILLEPLLRRSVFLEEAVERLGLGGRVRVERGRSEDLIGAYDVVTARAVAPLERLLGWTKHLLADDGQLLALKGSSAAEEVAEAARALAKAKMSAEVLTVRAHPEAEPTHVVKVTRTATA